MAAVNIDKIYAILSKEVKKYKAPITEFVGAQTKEPEQVLMAAILSARTNDKITRENAGREGSKSLPTRSLPPKVIFCPYKTATVVKREATGELNKRRVNKYVAEAMQAIVIR